MSTISKQWLQQTISEMEEHRDLFPGDLDDDHGKVLAALRIALASLEAEPRGYIGAGTPDDGISILTENKLLKTDIALYTAPPAPVSVPAAMEMDDDFDSAFEHGKAVGWNAYRAAMLQSFGNSEQLNSPVIQDGWVMVPEDPTHEMLEAGDEQFGTYDVYRRMIEAAPKLE